MCVWRFESDERWDFELNSVPGVGEPRICLGLHKQFAAAKSAAQKGILQRQIEATDAEIDQLVYDLYGLTAEEIAIVEGQSEPRQ